MTLSTNVIQSDQYPDHLCKIVCNHKGEYIVQGFYCTYRVATWGPYEDISHATDECFLLLHEAIQKQFLLPLQYKIASNTGVWCQLTLQASGFKVSIPTQQNHQLHQVIKCLLNNACTHREMIVIHQVEFAKSELPSAIYAELFPLENEADENPIQGCF